MGIVQHVRRFRYCPRKGHFAARKRELAGPTLAAYRRTWLKLVAWTTSSGIDLGALPREDAPGYYEDLTGNRSASHHLQVKAGIAFLYKVLLALRELGTDSSELEMSSADIRIGCFPSVCFQPVTTETKFRNSATTRTTQFHHSPGFAITAVLVGKLDNAHRDRKGCFGGAASILGTIWSARRSR